MIIFNELQSYPEGVLDITVTVKQNSTSQIDPFEHKINFQLVIKNYYWKKGLLWEGKDLDVRVTIGQPNYEGYM